MSNYKKFIAMANEAGLSASELNVSKKYDLSISIFRSAISSYSLSDTVECSARGIFNNKMGAASSERCDKKAFEYLIEQIKQNAIINEKEEEPIIFKGSPKYRKGNIYSKTIAHIPVDQKIANLYEIERKLKAADARISEVEDVSYCEASQEFLMANSYGLKLNAKSNYYYYFAGVVIKDGNEVKTAEKIFLSNNPEAFNIDRFVGEIISKAQAKLGGKPCKSGSYPTVFDSKCAAGLLSAFLSSAIAEEVQKHSSLLEGKLNQLVASKKLTVIEAPLTKNCFFRYFDDEGVATYNKPIIKRGVLQTYLYNLETAKKDGVTTTANGYRSGGKIYTSTVNVIVKPGRKSEEEMLSGIKEGVYINDLQGLHSGLNAQSGNFSLQASGFFIRNGKLAEPINLITVAGNLLSLFMDVKEVANNNELQLSSYSSPSLLIKKLAISGN